MQPQHKMDAFDSAFSSETEQNPGELALRTQLSGLSLDNGGIVQGPNRFFKKMLCICFAYCGTWEETF